MSLAEPVRVDGGSDELPYSARTYEPDEVSLGLVQHVREVGPRINVVRMPLYVTLDEADRIAHELLRLATEARRATNVEQQQSRPAA